jgi:hypothetical protein
MMVLPAFGGWIHLNIWFWWYRSCVLLSFVLAGAAFLEGGYVRPGVPACGVRLASGGRLLRWTVLREMSSLSPVYPSLSGNHKSVATQ